MEKTSLNSQVSVPGKQRRRSVAKTVRKFGTKESLKKIALPTPATISKRSRKAFLFRFFAVGTSFFILLLTLSLWRDKSLRARVGNAKSESVKNLRFSLPSQSEEFDEIGSVAKTPGLLRDVPDDKDTTPLTIIHENHESHEPHHVQKFDKAKPAAGQPPNVQKHDEAKPEPEQSTSHSISSKDLKENTPSELSETEGAASLQGNEKIERIPDTIEWYTRSDYKDGMRPICRISNPIVLSNGTILIPEWMQAKVKVLKRCGLGLYSFYPSSGPLGIKRIVDVDVDFALTIHLERFQEPTHVTSVYLTEHVLKSSFLFDTFAGDSRPGQSIKQSHCTATQTEESCRDSHPLKNTLKPGIFVPRRVERDLDSTWPRMFVEMFGKAHGNGSGATHLNASSILIRSHAKQTTELLGTRFRSIMSTDGMFRHLPAGALQHSSFFSEKNRIAKQTHERKKSGKCSVTIGMSKASDPETGFDASSELKEKLESLSKFTSFAQLEVMELETSSVNDLEELVKRMRGLDVFIAGSGEDMATIGFLSSGSAVFELMPFGIIPDTHRNLARALNLDYYSIKGKPQDESFKRCIALEIFTLRKRGKLHFSETPEWQQPVMKAWEAAVAEFVMSGASKFDILTSEEPVKNYHSKLCALKQKIEVGMDEAARHILGAAKEMCTQPESSSA